MADTKGSALAALTGAVLATNDEFIVVDVSDTTMAASGTDKNITTSELSIGLGLPALQTADAQQAGQIAARANADLGYYVIGSGLTLTPNATSVAGITRTTGGNTFSKTAHGFVANDTISFSGIVNTTGVSNGVVYFVSATNLTSGVFSVSLTAGGAVITLGGTTDTADITALEVGKFDMTTGLAMNNTTLCSAAAQTAISTTIASMADVSQPKWVNVELNTSGVVNFNQGAAAAAPAFPTITASTVLLGWIFVPANAQIVNALLSTADGFAKFIDARIFNPAPYGNHASWVFGDGSDGVATFDGSTSVAGCSLAGSAYTLTRDCFFTDANVTGTTSIIYTAGYRLFCTGTFNDQVNLSLHDTGGGILTSTGIGGLVNTTGGGGGGAGGVGSAGTTGGAGTPTTGSIGGNGGAGGLNSGSPSTGGGTAGATATAVTAAAGGPPHNVLNILMTGVFSASVGGTFYSGGAGGSAGTSSAGTGVGGAGGGGGGICILICRFLNIASGVTLTHSAVGSAGKAGTAGNSTNVGGGGGGGGGAAILIYWMKSSVGTLTQTAAGGAGGVAVGASARAGVAGSAGTTLQLQV